MIRGYTVSHRRGDPQPPCPASSNEALFVLLFWTNVVHSCKSKFPEDPLSAHVDPLDTVPSRVYGPVSFHRRPPAGSECPSTRMTLALGVHREFTDVSHCKSTRPSVAIDPVASNRDHNYFTLSFLFCFFVAKIPCVSPPCSSPPRKPPRKFSTAVGIPISLSIIRAASVVGLSS